MLANVGVETNIYDVANMLIITIGLIFTVSVVVGAIKDQKP